MVIDQVIYMPAGTDDEKFLVTVRSADNGSVQADVQEAAEGQVVTLTAHADAGYRLKELRVVNSVYYTMLKTIHISDPSGLISFTMPDDNVTIQPVFDDLTEVSEVDFGSVLNGNIPQGWRCVQESDDKGNAVVHEYPNSYGSGARTMGGFTGYRGKALYWRNDCAEYGRQNAYQLTLAPGDYKLTFAMAAWKEAPQYKAQVLDAATGSPVATSQVFTAAPNAAGNTSANVSSAVSRTLEFTIATKGNYVIRFSDETTVGGYHEFLLLDCRLNSKVPVGIVPATSVRHLPVGIYAPDGRQLRTLGRGMNIVVGDDGVSRKVMAK